MNEEEALELALRGKETGFRILYDKYSGFLFTLALRMLNDIHLAQDATQEAFAAAFRALPSFRRESRLKTWLYTILFRTVLQMQSKNNRETPTEISHFPQSGSQHAQAEKRLDVAAVLDQMVPRERAVLIMAYFDDLSCNEIAKVMKLKENHVKVMLFRAREQFRKLVLKVSPKEEVNKAYGM